MTDEEIEYVVKIVADVAWGIAYRNRFFDDQVENLCLRVEDISDDPVISKKLILHIKARLARDKNSPDWDFEAA